MTPSEYLEDRLRHCSVWDKGKRAAPKAKVEKYLTDLIKRKDFRKWKLSDIALGKIEQAVKTCVQKQLPFVFRIRFGGYKLWRLPSAPEVDWAEFFSIVHYCEYIAPMLGVHQPGAKLVFASDDIFVEDLDNISRSETEKYYQSFQKLLGQFKRYLPPNLSVEIIRSDSLYPSPESLKIELEQTLKDVKSKWHTQNPKNVKKAMRAARLNVKWDGIKDLTTATNEEKHQIIEKGAMLHEAIIQLPTINEFYDNTPGIIYLSAFPSSKVVALGTAKTSIVKFWVGTGVLERHGKSKYVGRILSPKQIDQLNEIPFEEMDIDLFPMHNFSKIKIYDKSLDFVHKDQPVY